MYSRTVTHLRAGSRLWFAGIVASLLIVAMLLPASAQSNNPCFLNGKFYAHGTVVQSGPGLVVCRNGSWQMVVFEYEELLERIDPALLKEFQPIPRFPDPKPWCLKCPPELIIDLKVQTLEAVEQEMVGVMESLERINEIVQNDPAFQQ